MSLLALNYHQITHKGLKTDAWRLGVQKSNFHNQLLFLKKEFDILKPTKDNIVNALEDSLLHILITFDDGYSDILEAVKILKKLGLQAVLFLAPAFINEPDFWWHNLESIFFTEDKDLETAKKLILPEWHNMHRIPFEHRQKLSRVAKYSRQRKSWMLSLNKLFNPSPYFKRPITCGELQKIIQSKVITFGSHTLTHAYLPCLDKSELNLEIKRGEDAVTLITGGESVGFAYPYGEYTEQAVDEVQNLGIKLAFTIENPYIVQKSENAKINHSLIPRLVVEDWPLQLFIQNINKCVQSTQKTNF